MNKAIIIMSVVASSLAFAPSVFAAGQFTGYLHYGQSNGDVESLQQFLSGKGYFNGPQTGNFLDMTEAAVKSYQSANGIPSTGYVGPLTLASINSSIALSASLSLVNPPSGSISEGQVQTINWTSQGSAPSSVSVNIIKKVADNPARYELVRTVAADKTNNGTATWVPTATDVGTSLSVEIGCGLSANACAAAESVNAPLAVVNNGLYANTASAYEAIESAMNK